MIRSSLRAISALLIATVAIVAPFQLAQAQAPSQAITISPASARLSIDPGASKTETFEIINSGDDGYVVDFSSAPYRVVGESYDPAFTQLPGTVDASEWIKLEHNSEFLEGQKVLSTSYTVSVPENTAPGGYYAVIFAQTSQEQPAEAGGVIPHNRVGNILYITVNGDVKQSGSATASDLPSLQFSPSVLITTNVANDGGIHFETNTLTRVTDFSGNEVFKDEQARMVLPSTSRAITSTWQNGAPVGIYTIERQATVAGETVTLPAHKIIIVSPWFLICLVIFLGSIVALLVMRIRQRKKENPSHVE